MIDRRSRLDALALAIVLSVSGALVWRKLFDGGILFDDGVMAHMAERVLNGDLPHRDFDEVWTGGWSFFQAGIFRVFGTSLAVMRVPIFVSWLLSLVAAFAIARRFAATFAAAVATFVCAVWSLYAWHLPLPNWYYPAFALWSVWAIVRYGESGRRWWLFAAGAGAGFALSFKITGLFLLAGLLLWAIARAGDRDDSAKKGPEWVEAGTVTRGYGAVALALAGVYAVMVVILMMRLPSTPGPMLAFAMPSLAVALWTARRAAGGGLTAGEGIRALGALLLPLLAGFAAALFPLVAWFAAQGAVGDLLNGVFVRPAVRMDMIWLGPPGRVPTLLLLPIPLLLFHGSVAARVPRPRLAFAFAVVVGALLGALVGNGSTTTEVAQIAVRMVQVALPLAGLAWSFGRAGRGRNDGTIFLLVACSTSSLLLQVPFAGWPYFLYGAPIAILAAMAATSRSGEAGRSVTAFAGAFLLVLGIRNPAAFNGESDRLSWTAPVAEGRRPSWLPFERAGIRAFPSDSVNLAALSRVMRERPPGPIFVSRGAPELYFLLDRPNPTRILLDALSGPESVEPRAIMQTLDRAGVLTVVIVNRDAWSDARAVTMFHTRLRSEFPRHRWAGEFDVRWRDSVPAVSASSRPRDQQH